MREAGDQAHSNRVHRQDENDWNRRCRLFDCDGRVSTRDNYIDFKAHELLRNLFEAFAAALCPAIFDRNVATFIPAEFAQPLHESGGPWFPGRCRGCTQKPDDRESARLLRARRERPGCRRATNERDELPPPHWLTPRPRIDHKFQYSRSGPCIAAIAGHSCPLWVNSVGNDRDTAAAHVRFAPKADN